ncbi:MAG: flagellar type III secretion system pore protein FliP [Saccharospirillaceae bacterium]|nr:flagellar type III secretion system pore protein FliP [Pseudomonadales bacterium]NRB79743.1 flagellar type III secretion system pore protein FliP [Saccharospirillaceae bacterium]
MFQFLRSKIKFILLITLPALFLNASATDVNELANNAISSITDQTVAGPIEILFFITLLSLAPSILIITSAFTRIIIVLSLLRQALGLQQTPPNAVLISLALFLSFFAMRGVYTEVYEQAYQPYKSGEISFDNAIVIAQKPIKEFMIHQTRESDLTLIYELKGDPLPESIEQVSLFDLAPAFLLSELFTAFQIGFIIFLPFLLIDIIVSSLLMSMGMMMVPPMMMSLPIKLLIFILIDGWALIARSLLGSFT